MVQQLKKLHDEKDRVNKQFVILSKVDIEVGALKEKLVTKESEVESLKGANTLLKNNKGLLEETNDRFSTSIELG